jgi:predicted membrane chloride channel (bestrophin family)
MYTKVSACLQVILDGQETLFRIITTPLPFPYHWILNAMLIVFVYAVPFLYESYRGASYFGTFVLVLSYFGCQRIAEQCENPLEWDACDLDVEALTMWVHDETRDISKFTHSQGSGYIPFEIRPPAEQPPAAAGGPAPAPAIAAPARAEMAEGAV